MHIEDYERAWPFFEYTVFSLGANSCVQYKLVMWVSGKTSSNVKLKWRPGQTLSVHSMQRFNQLHVSNLPYKLDEEFTAVSGTENRRTPRCNRMVANMLEKAQSDWDAGLLRFTTIGQQPPGTQQGPNLRAPTMANLINNPNPHPWTQEVQQRPEWQNASAGPNTHPQLLAWTQYVSGLVQGADVNGYWRTKVVKPRVNPQPPGGGVAANQLGDPVLLQVTMPLEPAGDGEPDEGDPAVGGAAEDGSAGEE